MKYRVEMLIELSRKEVFEMYTTKEHFERWELGLDRIESNESNIFAKDAVSFLIFKYNDKEMKMKMTVKNIKAPDKLEVIYEVPGAYNLCKNYFYDENDQTKWIMDVEFLFSPKVNIPKENFINKTKSGMQIFKDYALNKQNKK